MRWETVTSAEIDALDRDGTVVVLPLGSVEQHSNHMPLGTDSMLAHHVCLAAAEATCAVKVAVLPPPWYGFSAHHMRFAGTVTLSADTLLTLAAEIVESVVAHGFRRVLILNGHGGNGGAIDVLASTLGHRHYGEARIAATTYFQLAREEIAEIRLSRAGGMGHAGEFETAMMLHLFPELVKMDRATASYPDPGSGYLTTDLLGASPIRSYLDFRDVSESGVFGDPSLATPEQGARFFAAVSQVLARFIEDFAGWPIGRTGR